MHDFDEPVEKAAKFPQLDSRFTALEFYVNGLSEFIAVTCDQTELRLKAQIRREMDPVSQGELESELIELQETGRLEFSSTICGSVLVSIYFAWEASVAKIFTYLAQDKSLPTFENFKKTQNKENNGKQSFLALASAYSSDVLKIPLFDKALSLRLLEELRTLRNSYVHNGCSLDSISDRTRQNILNGKYSKALGYIDSKWYITPAGVSLFFKETHESFKNFQRRAIEQAIA